MKIILSSQHRVIIRNIAKEQQESFLRISRLRGDDLIRKELLEDGYNIGPLDIICKINDWREMWQRVENEPENFISILDGLNMAMVRHYILQSHGVSDRTRPIHRLLNLYDEVNSHLN
jgi:hypothetical protein